MGTKSRHYWGIIGHYTKTLLGLDDGLSLGNLPWQGVLQDKKASLKVA